MMPEQSRVLSYDEARARTALNIDGKEHKLRFTQRALREIISGSVSIKS